MDSNFPNGVLNFATASDFANFYLALDSAVSSSSASSGSSGVTPFSAGSTASATTNYAAFSVKLNAGQVLEVGTCDLEGSSFTGDTFLRLTLGGTEVASNDDACGGSGSRLSFTAATAGFYEVRMGCYSGGSCSGTASYSVLTPGMSGGLSGARTYGGVSTSSTTANYSTLVINLSQGQVLDVGTCGVTGSSVTGDSFLRLIDADGNVDIAYNDDACGGHGSRITYTADRTGVFELRLGCYMETTCSGTLAYTLTPKLSPSQMLPASFVSAKTYLAYARPGEQPGDAVVDVDYNEFVDDIADYLTEDDTLRRIVDQNLQVVIEGQLYQLTNMGVFQVDMSALSAYRAWLSTNAYAMNTDPNFQAIPGEVAIGGSSYRVMPGVIRTVGGFGTPSVKLLGFDDDGGDTTSWRVVPPVEGQSTLDGHGTAGAAVASGQPVFEQERSAVSRASDMVASGVLKGAGGAEVGRISYWYGKVNVHKAPGGSWLKDSDCTSGADIDPLTYCRKFFPGTTSVTEVSVTAKPDNLWNTASCAQVYSGNGLREWTCNDDSIPPPSCTTTPPAINFANYTVGSNFKRSESITFSNRRFVFKTQSPGFLLKIGGIEFGFHKIDIKGKLQRKKRFLGIGYWGPSYADEIVVGMDNMKLDTDYIVPHPQMYNSLNKPKFNGLADYEIGNWVVQAANISVNLKLPYYPITTQDVANWVNGGINSVIGNVYNDIWKGIETHVMDAIDPTYNTRYAAYTKMVSDIDDAYKLRWVSGKGEKPQCYSHENTWRFDANFGFRYVKGGGVAGPPGSPPTQVNYKYSMKAGSFYGRARLGGSWYGIRIVRTP
ncbi:hypothetical protein DAT35_30190 [Vitiosangium sp. GDMCC 1.1324]|nr:hypothetical protein DAT35_30190 [Vitiosangium sp. GDMCC 1.1324]